MDSKYFFENEQAYVAMELTKSWISAKSLKYDSYIDEEDIIKVFNAIYLNIGKVKGSDC